jgi:hypothetical protein
MRPGARHQALSAFTTCMSGYSAKVPYELQSLAVLGSGILLTQRGHMMGSYAARIGFASVMAPALSLAANLTEREQVDTEGNGFRDFTTFGFTS